MLVLVALPGVAADRVAAVIEDGDLLIAGTRVLPPELVTATIHRLELPQGRFERRLRLPAGRYSGGRTVNSFWRRVIAGSLPLAAFVLGLSMPTLAQDHPTHPVRLITDSAPGSSIDVPVRIIAEA